MEKRYKNLNDLTDSRIMFEKKLPAFGYMLIIIVCIAVGGALIWSIRTPKIYNIQANGTVTSENANYVMCTYTGEIAECNMAEGALVEEGDVLFTVKSTDYDLQEQQLLDNRAVYEEKVEKNRTLAQSIKDDTNYFDVANAEDQLYYSIFEQYKAQVRQANIDVSAYKAYGYSDEQIEKEVEKNQGKISEIYYAAIESAESAIEEAEMQISAIDAQLSAVGGGQVAYEVKANAAGTLHLLSSYKEGMVVQTGQAIASITPENEDNILEAYVSTADMARMHEGDEVQIVVDGLSQSVYGTISGAVKQIDSNVTTRESDSGNTQAFRVLLSMDSDYLVSYSGDKVDITNGMTAVARIQYDKVTYFRYALEKLGFKEK